MAIGSQGRTWLERTDQALGGAHCAHAHQRVGSTAHLDIVALPDQRQNRAAESRDIDGVPFGIARRLSVARQGTQAIQSVGRAEQAAAIHASLAADRNLIVRMPHRLDDESRSIAPANRLPHRLESGKIVGDIRHASRRVAIGAACRQAQVDRFTRFPGHEIERMGIRAVAPEAQHPIARWRR